MTKTLLVSNRLPVAIDADGRPRRTTGGLASALNGAGVEATWIGWSGVASEAVEDEDEVRRSFTALDVAPVFLSRTELDAYYEGYSTGTLWPLLHYMVDRAQFRADWSEGYAAANEKFARAVLDLAEEGDRVWIHDFHLFLVPRFLRESGKRLRIGFFLHTPFPSSEVFRALPERQMVLEGVLGADVIGFHTFGYLRHFRSSLLRVLGVESSMDTVWRDEYPIRLGVYPIGHDQAGFAAALASDEFEGALNEHKEELGDGRLVLGVERLDYTKGIPQKLAAIRRFLETSPEWRQRAAFVLIAVPSRQGIREYDMLTEEVQREVGSINGEFGSVGHTPVRFLHRGFSQTHLAALYALADVCMVTPLVDGMNLVAKEFLACKCTSDSATPGVLILSEFAGAAQELSHALLVNPYDVAGVASAISAALAMDPVERRERANAMGARLIRHDAAAWARTFLKDLDAVEPRARLVAGSARLAELASSLSAAVRKHRRLALFLDYDGTLRDFTALPEAAVPEAELRDLLRALAALPNVEVTVVSGRPSDFLERHLGGLGLTLVAEHGYRWLRRGWSDWSLVRPQVDTSWKESVYPYLQQAVDLTPGTSIEEKVSSIVWHYRRADPEFGLWKARGLLSELTDVTANLPVSVHHGKKIVEVASQLVNKGMAVRELVAASAPDIVVAVGDDQTDESMFALELDQATEFVTINVGQAATRAQRRTDIQGLRAFLEQLLEETSA